MQTDFQYICAQVYVITSLTLLKERLILSFVRNVEVSTTKDNGNTLTLRLLFPYTKGIIYLNAVDIVCYSVKSNPKLRVE